MTLDDTIGYMLGRIARKIHYRVDGVFKEYGITVEQWVALKTIAEYEPLCQKALAERIEKNQNTVKALVMHLENKGCIDRTPDPSDMRHMILRTTEKGRDCVERLSALDEHANLDFLGALSTDEQEELRRMLRKIEAKL